MADETERQPVRVIEQQVEALALCDDLLTEWGVKRVPKHADTLRSIRQALLEANTAAIRAWFADELDAA